MEKKNYDYIIEMKDGRLLPFSVEKALPGKEFDMALSEWFEDDYDNIKSYREWSDVVAIKVDTITMLVNAVYPEKDEPMDEIKSYDDILDGLASRGWTKLPYIELITSDRVEKELL